MPTVHIVTQNMILDMRTVHIEGRRTKLTNIFELFKETRCLLYVIGYLFCVN
jgi:hypothetical protein